MNIKQIAATGAVAIGLGGSGLVFSQAWSNPAAPAAPSSPSSHVSLDAVVAKAADQAALVMMCRQGQLDPAAVALLEHGCAEQSQLRDGLSSSSTGHDHG